MPRGDASKIEQCPIGAAGGASDARLMPPVWVTSLNIMGAAVSTRAVRGRCVLPFREEEDVKRIQVFGFTKQQQQH